MTSAAIPFLEFFAGAGLVRLGLEAAGFAPVFANDIDEAKERVYVENFGAAHFVRNDIHRLRGGELPDAPLATASFPCVDLSLAGGRSGLREGRESSAFFGFTRLLGGMKARRPKVVLIENVVGFLTSGAGNDLGEALRTLNSLGYRVDLFTLDARRFVPQSRPRLFIVGVRGGGSAIHADRFARRSPALVTPRLQSVVERARGEVAFSFLPIPPPPEAPGATLADLLEPSPPWWPAERTGALLAQMPEKDRRRLEEAARRRVKLVGALFRRVRKGVVTAEARFDGLAGCLRTPRGGSSKQVVVAALGGEIVARSLTAREAARLMGVPESYRLPPRENGGLFAFGDAVCVPALAWIGREVLRPLFP